jgi:hypothetical protein
MKTAGLIALVVLLSVAVALAATNPTTHQYATFLETSLVRALDQMEGQETQREREVIRQLLRSQGKQVIESLTRSNTIRRSYGFFSIFETRALDVRVEVLGIGGMFFPLGDEEDLTRKLGQLVL